MAARKRDHAKIHARRQQIAAARLEALGVSPGKLKPATALRKLSASQKAESQERVARALAGRGVEYHGGGRGVVSERTRDLVRQARGKPKRGAPSRVKTAGGVKISTSSNAAITKAITAAAAKGQRVAAFVSIGAKSFWLDGRGNQQSFVASGGGGEVEPRPAGEGGGATGSVQLYVGGADVARGGGIDAGDLLDFYDDLGGDWWDVFQDIDGDGQGS